MSSFLPACLFFLLVAATTAASQRPKTYLPRLPMGEFRVMYDAVYSCQRNRKNEILALDLYLSRKSKNETVIIGNMTFRAPIDDKLNYELNFASWGTTGGWKENSAVYRSKKSCTAGRQIMGHRMWKKVMDSFGVPSLDCPLPMGEYRTSGLNVRTLDDNNLTKVYFYGKYKIVLYTRDEKNAVVGCTALEVRLVRPWEMAEN